MRIGIIGGGIHGAATGYFLTELGADDVLIFDEGNIGGISTSKSVGIVRAHYSHDTHIRVLDRSREILERIDEGMGLDQAFIKNGYLAVAGEAEEEPFRHIVSNQQAAGIDVDLLEPDELGEYLPAIGTDELAIGAIEHDSGFGDPYQITLGFAEGARERGATLYPNTKVTGLNVDTNSVTHITTESTEYEVDYVVNAAGPFAHSVGEMVGVDLPLTWHGATIAVLTSSREYTPDLPTIMDISDGLYVKPEHTGDFIAGGFGQIPVTDPRDQLGTVSEDHLLNLHDLLTKRLPGYADAEVVNTWSGLITTTPDGKQIIGCPNGLDNFYNFVGGNGHGFKEAAGFAESIAQEILGHSPRFDLSRYRLERYEEEDTFESVYSESWIS